MDQETAIEANIYGDACLRKQRKKRQKMLIVELLYDFANKTTLHGLRYIIDRSLNSIEKIFWLITFLISASVCFYIITQVWYKWQHSPVIVTVSEELVPVGSVPFPSVTICPQNKCNIDRFNYSMYALNENHKNNTKYRDVSLVCGEFNTKANLLRVQRWPPMNVSTVHNILDVAPTLEDVLLACAWRGTGVRCGDIFSTVLTEEGVCFNANGLAAGEMFREHSTQAEYEYTTRKRDVNDTEPYPRHGRGNGASPDLSVVLWEDRTRADTMCNGINSGYRIYVQHPDDMARSSMHYFAASHSSVTSLALSFSIMNTSESLRPYPADVRQCYYPENRPLRYFKTYTASNCRLECWSNYTYRHCGCYWFSMPHNDSAALCGQESGPCVLAVLDALAQGDIRSAAGGDACHCLPACESVEYDADALKTDFHLRYVLDSKYPLFANISRAFTNINLYYKKPSFVSMRRSELFGWVEFLANCGGLLGLFLGFSFLSLVEIFYFLTLRLCSTFEKDLQEEKSDKQKK